MYNNTSQHLHMDFNAHLHHWAATYRSVLTQDIMPFWMQHGWDRLHGGVYTCLDQRGELMDSTKSVWFQGRFAYVTALAYRSVEKRQEWLDASRSCIDFLQQHCTDAEGRMYFEVTAEGTPLRQRRYLFSECFAAMAMAEYAVASGNQSYGEKALELFRLILRYRDTPGLLAPKYLPALQSQGHSLTMILINVAARVRQACPHPLLDAEIAKSVDRLERHFMHPEFAALLETVGPNGEFIDTCMGRTINPGHCMETAWFILEEARHQQWDAHLTELGLRIMEWAWQWGWDEQYGGVINFRDCRHLPPQDYSQDMKFWWPQTEAIIATLYAALASGDDKWLERHRLVTEWAWKHLPDPENGEWFGYLHRDGTVAQPAKGNLFKGPFHIPRMLILAEQLCHDLLAKREK